mmetsp:Transcript_11561/g.42284  ORF Transcript_11561/g.42284 Transcript_11561/m.42284 type:complete len:2481 (+) Transcript_11561:259-7701(+)
MMAERSASSMDNPESFAIEELTQVLADLDSSPREAEDVLQVAALRTLVEAKARDLSGEAFKAFTTVLYGRVSELMRSPKAADVLRGVRAIEQLIELQLLGSEPNMEFARFATLLGSVLQPSSSSHDGSSSNGGGIHREHNDDGGGGGGSDYSSEAVLRPASAALGHLTRVGGALTAEVAQAQVSRALECLEAGEPDFTEAQPQEVHLRRYAAVLVLKELADNAPEVFNNYVPRFISSIWTALRDAEGRVRAAAVSALQACLCVVEKRETRYRLQWYMFLYDEYQAGLRPEAPPETIHGSLLVVGELLRYTGEFMLARYKEVVDTVLGYRRHPDKLIQRRVTQLVPRVAHFSPERFARDYLEMSLLYLQESMRSKDADRGQAFLALAEVADAVRSSHRGRELLRSHLRDTLQILHEAISNKKKGFCPEALICIGSLAKAEDAMSEHCSRLLPDMFNAGLSQELVSSLSELAATSPSLLPLIRERLLNLVSLVLVQRPYHPGADANGTAAHSSGTHTPILIRRALETLGTFDLDAGSLLEFLCDSVLIYLEDDEAATRQAAAVACCSIIKKSEASCDGWKRLAAVEEILEKLLAVALSDVNAAVRCAVLKAFSESPAFDQHLSQARALWALFFLLNDANYAIKKTAVEIVGRLSSQNPAHTLPALRQHLRRLLIDVEHAEDNKLREESTRLLGILIRSCTSLMGPYVMPVLNALLAKPMDRRDSLPGHARAENVSAVTRKSTRSGYGEVESFVLSTIGDLSYVGGAAMRAKWSELLPLVIVAMSNSDAKRHTAVSTLGQLVQSTGYAVKPYREYPALLGMLLRMLNVGVKWEVRREVLRVLGVIGALDPHIHKENQRQLRLGTSGASGMGEGVDLLKDGDCSDSETEYSARHGSSKELYEAVAFNTLLRALHDSSLASIERQVMLIESLMSIFMALGVEASPYLKRVVPSLFRVLRTCEPSLRPFILDQLAKLVSIVRQHIRHFLDELMKIVHEFWEVRTLTKHLLRLLKALSGALNDEFHTQLPAVIRRFVALLVEAERSKQYTHVSDVLDTLDSFGNAIADQFHLVLGALARLLRSAPTLQNASVRAEVILKLASFTGKGHVSSYASEIVNHLSHVLDTPADQELHSITCSCLAQVARAIGPGFSYFVPRILHIMVEHNMQRKHATFYNTIIAYSEGRDTRIFEGLLIDEVEDGMYTDAALEAYESFQNSVEHEMNEENLRMAWQNGTCSTQEDWADWMRRFSTEVLKESPSPALRACQGLAGIQPLVGRELFCVAFASCWPLVEDRDGLVKALKRAFASSTTPAEIVVSLLSLAEFMEHDEKPLPMNIGALAAFAEKCHAFAKALYYKETEWLGNEGRTATGSATVAGEAMGKMSKVEALISINSHLHLPEAAKGILVYAKKNNLLVELKANWYEMLQSWDRALEGYRKKKRNADDAAIAFEAALGEMRCLSAMAKWDDLGNVCREEWRSADNAARFEMASIGANCAWQLGNWEDMEGFVSVLDPGLQSAPVRRGTGRDGSRLSGVSDGAFFSAVLSVHKEDYRTAQLYIGKSRELLATELAALVSESYERAYGCMVRVQQLAELEEVIEYKRLDHATDKSDSSIMGRKEVIREMWWNRLLGTQRDVDVWQSLLTVRRLALAPEENLRASLKFASLARKTKRIGLSEATLVGLLGYDPKKVGRVVAPLDATKRPPPAAVLGYLKYMWSSDDKIEAYNGLKALKQELDTDRIVETDPILLSRVMLKLGLWRWQLKLDESVVGEVQQCMQSATELDPKWPKAWHLWGLFNLSATGLYPSKSEQAMSHVVPAIEGFLQSISLGAQATSRRDGSLQDILRLLNIMYKWGTEPHVAKKLEQGFGLVTIDTWLAVLPQIIGRMGITYSGEQEGSLRVQELIYSLLVRVGQQHPQALVFPMLLGCKATTESRSREAQRIIDSLRRQYPKLIEEAQLVSHELIRTAISWDESWFSGLERASAYYYGQPQDIDGMLEELAPLHEMISGGGETTRECGFHQNYGPDLEDAKAACDVYKETGKEEELAKAWDLYYNVFNKISKQRGDNVSSMNLNYVSPQLVKAKNLELAVPGTYRANEEAVTISSFLPEVTIITSKQRPRKLTIRGSDGQDHHFLLKGNEDLRQDERVMQLFRLVNILLQNDRVTAPLDLLIQRYAVIPLSHMSGLVGWVPNTDTLHTLIKDYRTSHRITFNIEYRYLHGMAPDYERLPLIAKLEVFQHVLACTKGDDLYKILWLKSRSSESWLERRTNYTRSLAVMSMVGYLLGLGDRHPSNLLVDRLSGRVTHIDFGDCFEVAMQREKYPEKVPFRLTRMLVKAMEVSGIEGNFRSTCEKVMRVMRNHKDFVMAILETFVFDPLVCWRKAVPKEHFRDTDSSLTTLSSFHSPEAEPAQRPEFLLVPAGSPRQTQEGSEEAHKRMNRMKEKLTGKDFSVRLEGNNKEVPVPKQVDLLIRQAISHENLCQHFLGWCSFW